MTRGRLWLVVVAGLACFGCTANFFVGEMPETETDGPSSEATTGDATMSSSASLSSDPTLPSSSGMSTSGMTTTTMSTSGVDTVTETTDPTTTMSESETMPTTESSSSSSSAEGPTTTGPPTCAEQPTQDACQEVMGCLWLGEVDECVEACEQNPCMGLANPACEDMVAQCLWLGEGELGTCYFNECLPCAKTDNMDLCMAALNCMWNEGEMTCLPVE